MFVEVVLTANRFISLHEDAGGLPLPAVEVLHGELSFIPCPLFKSFRGHEKSRVIQDLNRQLQIILPALKLLKHPNLTRKCQQDLAEAIGVLS